MVTKKSEGGTWVTITDVAGALDAVAQSAVEGERRLMIAVLAHALRSLFHDAAKPGRGAARRLQQDLRWLTSSDRDDPFAFERICEALDLEPDRIRRRILDELGVQTAAVYLESFPSRRRGARALPPDLAPPPAIAV